MPVICIGPVCIPITMILPVLLFIFKPIYDRLPASYQKKVDKTVVACQLTMNSFLRKIGWIKQKSKKNDDTKKEEDTDDKTIKEIQNEDEWDEIINQSKNDNTVFIAYYTAKYITLYAYLYIRRTYIYQITVLI